MGTHFIFSATQRECLVFLYRLVLLLFISFIFLPHLLYLHLLVFLSFSSPCPLHFALYSATTTRNKEHTTPPFPLTSLSSLFNKSEIVKVSPPPFLLGRYSSTPLPLLQLSLPKLTLQSPHSCRIFFGLIFYLLFPFSDYSGGSSSLHWNLLLL